MKSFCLATWNVNSVRLRLPHIARFVHEQAPDVLCLQEIKCREHEFPFQAFHDMGFPYIELKGQKGLHGVATVSRFPQTKQDHMDLCPKGEARHLITCVEGLELHNLYIPAGGDVPDPACNEKFAHKLSFLERMAEGFAKLQDRSLVLTGDFNVAPYEHDVWSHRQMIRIVSHTPEERERLEKARACLGFIDTARHFYPEPQKLYSWWSYRARDWAKSNRGRRLDHIWLSPDLQKALPQKPEQALRFHLECRGWERPSDHIPVLIQLNL